MCLNGWKKRFAKAVTAKMKEYKKDGIGTFEKDRIIGMNTIVYLLGVSIDKKKYSLSKGYEKFLKDFRMEELNYTAEDTNVGR